MEGNYVKINKWLLPFSWIYGIIVWIRNHMFDMGIHKSKAYDIPIISIGNITVGGSGKTPCVEYLINLLKDHINVAVLSRGYKRKSKGYVLATTTSTLSEIGDEPLQIKQKFPNIIVAVDKNRCNGIERLINDTETKDVDVIILDDAFQHRYVKPGINILLVDYHRLLIYDYLLPAGRLREQSENKVRADIVIVTKCPKELKPMDYRVLTKTMNLYPYQTLIFSSIEYEELEPMYSGENIQLHDIKNYNALLLTGIATPQTMYDDLKQHVLSITQLTFNDHHNFSDKDIERLNTTFSNMPSPKIIITTEKDSVRLFEKTNMNDEVRNNMYILPIKVKILLDQEEMFNKKILSYVQTNSRNSILAKAKDDYKPQNSNNSGNRVRTISFRNN